MILKAYTIIVTDTEKDPDGIYNLKFDYLTWDEAYSLMTVSFKNGYDILIKMTECEANTERR